MFVEKKGNIHDISIFHTKVNKKFRKIGEVTEIMEFYG